MAVNNYAIYSARWPRLEYLGSILQCPTLVSLVSWFRFICYEARRDLPINFFLHVFSPLDYTSILADCACIWCALLPLPLPAVLSSFQILFLYA